MNKDINDMTKEEILELEYNNVNFRDGLFHQFIYIPQKIDMSISRVTLRLLF